MRNLLLVSACLFAPVFVHAQRAPQFPRPFHPLGGAAGALCVLDWNADSVPDLFATHTLEGQVSLTFGRSGGSLGASVFEVVQSPQDLAHGDWNRDGFVDVCAVEGTGATKHVISPGWLMEWEA